MPLPCALCSEPLEEGQRVSFTTYPAALATKAYWGTKGNGKVWAETAWSFQTGMGCASRSGPCTRASQGTRDVDFGWGMEEERRKGVSPGPLLHRDRITGTQGLRDQMVPMTVLH